MPELLLATNNRGKLEELRLLFAGLPYRILSPAEIGLELEVPETGATYAANARLKATAFARASGLLTLADDSGLEVEALAGAPGVMSSRYAGPGASDADRIDFLLAKLVGLPHAGRRARFRCVMALVTSQGQTRLCSGTCRGFIASEPRGSQGFGYDPVFFVPRYNKTMSELDTEVKNRTSHRARAAARMSKILLGMG
jgi:XTP/dITP diphosphohydrolase